MANQDQVVAFLQDNVGDVLRTARETASRIQNGGLVPLQGVSLNYEANIPVLAPPPKFSDLFPGADGTSAELQRLDSETDKWFERYFPEFSVLQNDSPEAWACKILSGSDPYADSKAVLDLLWHEARDRAYRVGASERRSIDASFAERGFPLPPGVAVRLGVEAEQRATQAIADINRQQTGRMLELKVELIKFAEEQAVRLKLGVMDALRAFYTTWVSLPDKDIERARVQAQAQASLYGALSSYYNVQLGFEGLRLRAAEADVEAALGIDRNKIAAFTSNRSASALSDTVRGFTEVASSGLNAQSALFAEITTG
ncbi:hypothetical protein [Pseudomonas sp. OTU750018]|uniref:hypothetical protein n=1 Tax=Pseudomonas sp. OTU750018 TaxID=2709708 RepID=UPI001422DD1F|nr:hypothetical protein [Pseudomonas sp. OTU750018]